MVDYWNGDAWRWHTNYHPHAYHRTIQVIEPATERDEPKHAHRVPFGFGIRTTPEPIEPLLWEGED